MSMSLRVTGFIPATDPTYIKHANVLRACVDAEIGLLPGKTAAYFGAPLAELYLLEEKLTVDLPLSKYQTDSEDGYELRVADIPPGVERIRFVAAY